MKLIPTINKPLKPIYAKIHMQDFKMRNNEPTADCQHQWSMVNHGSEICTLCVCVFSV